MLDGRWVAVRWTAIVWATVAVLQCSVIRAAGSSQYTCFSLRTAQTMTVPSQAPGPEIGHLGWVTRVVGMVHDPERDDLIDVGNRDPEYPEILLDDLVVALRVVFLHPEIEYPGLSIEPDKEDVDPWHHKVRYIGGIDSTRFGLVCFRADSLLKVMNLGLAPSGLSEVPSCWEVQQRIMLPDADYEDRGDRRSFFYPISFKVLVLGHAGYLQSNRIAVLTDIASSGTHDLAGEYFAKQVTEHFFEIASRYPVLEELRNMMSLYALAKGVESMREAPDLTFWLHNYYVDPVGTPTRIGLLGRGVRGLAESHIAIGQLELRPQVLMLEAGDPIALEEIVLETRPSDSALTWTFELRDGDIHAPRSLGEAVIAELTDRGVFHLARGRCDDALDEFANALKCGADPRGLLNHKARALACCGMVTQALEECDRGVVLYPEDWALWLTRAEILAVLGRSDEAGRDVAMALEVIPPDEEAWLDVAELQLRLGQPEEAMQLIEVGGSRGDGNARAHLLAGQALEKQGRDEDALRRLLLARRSSANPNMVRLAAGRVRSLESRHGWARSPRLPETLPLRRPFYWEILSEVWPAYTFGQAYRPREYRTKVHTYAVSAPLVTTSRVVMWNRLQISAEAAFDLQLRTVQSEHWDADESGAPRLTNVASAYAIFGGLDRTEFGVDWLVLDGFWSRPFLMISNHVRSHPSPEPAFEFYPMRKKGYSIAPNSLPLREPNWHDIIGVRSEIPLGMRWWLSAGLSYDRTLETPIADYITADLRLRSLRSITGDGIYLGIGMTIISDAILVNSDVHTQQVFYYVRFEKSSRRRSVGFNLGVLTLRDPDADRDIYSVVGSLDLRQQLVALKGWF